MFFGLFKFIYSSIVGKIFGHHDDDDDDGECDRDGCGDGVFSLIRFFTFGDKKFINDPFPSRKKISVKQQTQQNKKTKIQLVEKILKKKTTTKNCIWYVYMCLVLKEN